MDVESPRVDVVMPVFNSEDTVAEALDSISRQSFQSFRCLVVDDGSSDASAKVIRAHCLRDPRFQLTQVEHIGLVRAANLAWLNGEAEFVARLDSDDRMPPDRLEKQLQFLVEQPDVGIVSGQVSGFPRERVSENMQHYLDWLNGCRTHDEIVRDLFVESPIANPSVMVRRSVLENLGGYREFDGPEDYDLWLRAWAEGVRFGKVAERVLEWRHHDGRITFLDERYSPLAFRKLKVSTLVNTRLSGKGTLGDAGAGRDGKSLGRCLAEHGRGPDFWLELNPRKIGQKIQGAPVYHYHDTASWLPLVRESGGHILCCVGVKGARDIIREALKACGLLEQLDFTCVA